jgi:hypothetical protein
MPGEDCSAYKHIYVCIPKADTPSRVLEGVSALGIHTYTYLQADTLEGIRIP